MSPPQPTPEVYQLHIYLLGISPAIWRRILVRSDSTIADLHQTIQISMGWTDSHLNRFLIRGKEYGVAQLGGIGFNTDPDAVRLADFGFRVRERFLYEYDFWSRWQHQIRVEKTLPLDRKRSYPTSVGGQRAAPPEDCGGPWRYMELRDHYSLGYIAGRLTEFLEEEEGDFGDRYDELVVLHRWLTADRCDRRSINRQLKHYALGREKCSP